MKKNVLLFLAMMLAACSSGNNGITNPGGTSTIQNWPSGRTGSIRLTAYPYSPTRFRHIPTVLTDIPVAADGSFAFALPSSILPDELTAGARGLCINLSSSLTIGNDAKFAAVLPIAFVGGQGRGFLSYSSKSYMNFPLDVQVGDEMTVLVYADKATQVTGACSQVAQNFTPAQQYKFNLTLRQGWNYVRGRVSSLSPITVDILIADSTPPRTSWTYVSLPTGVVVTTAVVKKIGSFFSR